MSAIGNGARVGYSDTRVSGGGVFQSHLNLQFGFLDVYVIIRGRNVKGDGLDALVHGSVVDIPPGFKPKIRGRNMKKVES